MSKKVLLSTCSSIVLLSLVAMPLVAVADDKPVSAELVLEWQNEYRENSDDATIDGTNNSFVRAELAPTIRASENFFIDGVLVFEPLDQAAGVNANDDIWFDRNGAFFEELKLNFESGPYAAWAGKFNPAFGTAWDYGRGIWSEDFAEDYEITEKIGGGASYTVDTGSFGTHTLGASTFFTDTTELSKAAFTARDQTELSDGGSGNTEDLSSYAVSLNSENLAGIEGLTYNLAYRFLAEQDSGQSATTDDETGFVIGAGYVVPVDENLSFDTLVEYASIDNYAGVTDANRDYYYASVIANINKNWNVTGGYTCKRN